MIDEVLVAGIAAAVGCLLGLFALIQPMRTAAALRLMPDPARRGGFATFRGGFGGFLLFGHLAVLLAISMQAQAGLGSVIGTSFAMGAAWIGAALGRALSMVLDHAAQRTRSTFNGLLVAFGFAIGLALMAPFLGHLGGG